MIGGGQQPKSDNPTHVVDSRIIRVPYNYKRYQQTRLNRSAFTHIEDKLSNCPLLSVQGEKIEGHSRSQQQREEVQVDEGLLKTSWTTLDYDYQIMNALGETDINFYEYPEERTWFPADYEFNYDTDLPLHRSGSNTDNSKMMNCEKYKPHLCPKTKQIIRVHVKTVAPANV